MQFLSDAWEFQYALLPCLTAYLIFDFPIFVRRITRKLYAPVYFAFFPFGFSDELYARYFDDDRYYVLGGPYSELERPTARVKIIWLSVLSLAATLFVSPFVAALYSHIALSDSEFLQFVWTLAIVKAILLLWALYDLHFRYRITRVVPFAYLVLIYTVYWGALLVILNRSKAWIDATVEVGGLSAVFLGVLEFLVFEIGFQIVLVSLLGFLIPWWVTRGANGSADRDA